MRQARARHRARPASARSAAVAVSAVTGAGPGRSCVAALDRLAGGLPVPDPGGPVRLWVDRAFSMTGSGTVVTGTLPAGTVHRGDELLRDPGHAARCGSAASRRSARARPPRTGVARVALNLRGVRQENLARGMALRPGRPLDDDRRHRRPALTARPRSAWPGRSPPRAARRPAAGCRAP